MKSHTLFTRLTQLSKTAGTLTLSCHMLLLTSCGSVFSKSYMVAHHDRVTHGGFRDVAGRFVPDPQGGNSSHSGELVIDYNGLTARGKGHANSYLGSKISWDVTGMKLVNQGVLNSVVVTGTFKVLTKRLPTLKIQDQLPGAKFLNVAPDVDKIELTCSRALLMYNDSFVPPMISMVPIADAVPDAQASYGGVGGTNFIQSAQ